MNLSIYIIKLIINYEIIFRMFTSQRKKQNNQKNARDYTCFHLPFWSLQKALANVKHRNKEPDYRTNSIKMVTHINRT